MREEILRALEKCREISTRRNFVQTFELLVKLKEIDLKKPENRIDEDVVLPHQFRETRIVVFSDKRQAKDAKVLGSKQIEKLTKREIKKLARETDFFLADPELMPLLGKRLGKILAPRGKIPRVIRGSYEKMLEDYKKAVRIRTKDSPAVQCPVGNEKMQDEKVAENVETLLKFLQEKLPKGRKNLGKILLKLSMGRPVEVKA